MVVLKGNLPDLAAIQSFDSPWPSYASPNAIARFNSLLKGCDPTQEECSPSDLRKSAGYMASLQAGAWQDASQIAARGWLTGNDGGGAPRTMLQAALSPETLKAAKLGVSKLKAANLFGKTSYSSSTSTATLSKDASSSGVSLGMDATTALPIVGGILKSAITVGKFMLKLAKEASAKPADLPRLVPQLGYDRDLDEDIVELISGAHMGGPDWTSLWMPPQKGTFELEKTQAGEGTAAYGVFSAVGNPIYTGGFGLLPGTQQGCDVIQVARVYAGPSGVRDIVTNAADFRPSVLELGTVAWGWVERWGSPAMFRVAPRQLGEAWERYWDDFFGDGLDRLESLPPGFERQALAKTLARWLCFKDGGRWWVGLAPNFIETASNLDAVIDGNIFSPSKNKLVKGRKYYKPSKLVWNACNRLAKRQGAALERTVVSALVRPVAAGGREAFAAFGDDGPAIDAMRDRGYNQSTFGGQLTAYAQWVRDELVDHKAKLELWEPDVIAVDPQYANRLDLPAHGVAQDFTTGKKPFKMGKFVAKALGRKPPGPGAPEGQGPFDDYVVSRATTARRVLGAAAIVGGALWLKG